MKLLMENWRKYLTEISVFEKDAAVNTVLDRMGKSEFYPEVDDARVFVNRQASMLMARVPMVWAMIPPPSKMHRRGGRTSCTCISECIYLEFLMILSNF